MLFRSQNAGSGYTTATINLIGSTGTGAIIEPVIGTGPNAGKIVSVNIIDGGTGYSTIPTIEVVGDGSNAVLNAVLDINIDIPDSYGDNNKFKSEASGFVQFSQNPFGDL